MHLQDDARECLYGWPKLRNDARACQEDHVSHDSSHTDPTYSWKPAGRGDCGGQDYKCSTPAVPMKEVRNAGGVGSRLITLNATRECCTNLQARPATAARSANSYLCTHKHTHEEFACMGGGNQGAMYVCSRELSRSSLLNAAIAPLSGTFKTCASVALRGDKAM